MSTGRYYYKRTVYYPGDPLPEHPWEVLRRGDRFAGQMTFKEEYDTQAEAKARVYELNGWRIRPC